MFAKVTGWNREPREQVDAAANRGPVRGYWTEDAAILLPEISQNQ
jgi:hypothetical protein